ncbi:MAG: hypothetical protein IKL36_03585 [Clostridia bacterium]|nr:hypothetical protein [Clostridia bacterium]
MKIKKQKKEKVIYVDDGRSLADMSGVSGGLDWTKKGTSSPVSEIWRTYWSAVKMMFKPMLVVIGFILAVFIIVSVFFWIM